MRTIKLSNEYLGFETTSHKPSDRISFAARDENHIKQTEDFLFNPNRLSVIISRANTKVIIFASQPIKELLGI